MRAWSVLVPLPLLLSGCAGNVDVTYPVPGVAEEAGHVIVAFTEPMASVTVQMDDVLVVEEEHTGRVQIRDVPAGQYVVTVAASESSRTRSVRHVEALMVEAGRTTSLVLDTPPHSTGYWIQSSLIMLWPLAWILAR